MARRRRKPPAERRVFPERVEAERRKRERAVLLRYDREQARIERELRHEEIRRAAERAREERIWEELGRREERERAERQRKARAKEERERRQQTDKQREREERERYRRAKQERRRIRHLRILEEEQRKAKAKEREREKRQKQREKSAEEAWREWQELAERPREPLPIGLAEEKIDKYLVSEADLPPDASYRQTFPKKADAVAYIDRTYQGAPRYIIVRTDRGWEVWVLPS